MKAIATERLRTSVFYVGGRPRIRSFPDADAEWLANTDPMKGPELRPLSAERKAARAGATKPRVETWAPERFSVFQMKGVIALAYETDPGDEDAIEIIPLAPETALLLAERLYLAAAAAVNQ